MSRTTSRVRVGHAPPPRFPKVTREHTVVIKVETELCPQVLLRVLGVLAARGMIPFTIAVRREDSVQHIEIEIDALPDRAETTLLQSLRRIIMVRSVSLSAWEEASIPAPSPKI